LGECRGCCVEVVGRAGNLGARVMIERREARGGCVCFRYDVLATGVANVRSFGFTQQIYSPTGRYSSVMAGLPEDPDSFVVPPAAVCVLLSSLCRFLCDVPSTFLFLRLCARLLQPCTPTHTSCEPHIILPFAFLHSFPPLRAGHLDQSAARLRRLWIHQVLHLKAKSKVR
jgi:hypothetical protein